MRSKFEYIFSDSNYHKCVAPDVANARHHSLSPHPNPPPTIPKSARPRVPTIPTSRFTSVPRCAIAIGWVPSVGRPACCRDVHLQLLQEGDGFTPLQLLVSTYQELQALVQVTDAAHWPRLVCEALGSSSELVLRAGADPDDGSKAAVRRMTLAEKIRSQVRRVLASQHTLSLTPHSSSLLLTPPRYLFHTTTAVRRWSGIWRRTGWRRITSWSSRRVRRCCVKSCYRSCEEPPSTSLTVTDLTD